GLLTRSNSAAATVNGHEISDSSFQDLLDAYRRNPTLTSQVTDKEGHVTTATSARLLQGLVFAELVREELVRRDLGVTSADIAKARQSIVRGNPAPVVKGFPKWFIDDEALRSARVVALQSALHDTDGSRIQAWLVDALRRARVSV